ncbi:hypothetical protein D9758_012130 [Tetrapyrgos nigripes]|uniref:RING-type domain-containing protein n=1 Tax=Tetrapyrgos nigripes TaxID=182062 RepID=A0A8H5CLH5_9AGAR|nr:hypothetical protein D9758_012130 [Tetrapyrgos nigripes]
MRIREPTTSYHNESLRSHPGNTGYHVRTGYWLHLSNVINLIHSTQNEEIDPDAFADPVPTGNGKKRALGSPSAENRGKKRTKLNPSTAGSSEDTVENPYPDIPDLYDHHGAFFRDYSHANNGSAVPVHRHVFELQFNSSAPEHASGNDRDHQEDFEKEERWFMRELKDMYGDIQEPSKVDLGDALMREDIFFSTVTLGSEMLPRDPHHNWLLTLPQYNPDNLSHDAFDLPEVLQDLLIAFLILSAHNRATVTANLSLILLPETAYDSSKNELPFRFQVEVKFALVVPTICQPFDKGTRFSDAEEARRRVLLFLYPLSPDPPASFEGAINVPFYYSVMRPAPALPSKELEEAMQPKTLVPTLLPFQRRTVAWMLSREGVKVAENGKLAQREESTDFSFWEKVQEGNYTWYLHRLSGVLSDSIPSSEQDSLTFGGILAEEPGLGKTVETIALITLNPPSETRNPAVKSWDPETELEVKEVRATLIVTPAALVQQWMDEFRTHAPHLKVHFYDGWSNVKVPINQTQINKERERRQQAKQKAQKRAGRAENRAASEKNIAKSGRPGKQRALDDDVIDVDEDSDEEIVDWVAFAHSFDVVITTYNVLQGDLNVARAPPTRPRRDCAVYSNVDRPRSPLVLVEWNRVVMDEVQMAGGGKTEDMVSLIPRVTSFAVSGTPARTHVADLIHVLKFLRVNQLIGNQRMWNRLLLPGYARLFADFFGHYSVRTQKSCVSEELTIPQQTRYLVSIEMGRVERHVYDQALEEVRFELGLDARGVAASAGWEIDGALLRSSIRKLRGICTHPQVGQLMRGANEKHNKSGTLKSMADVLQMMKDQNWRNMMDDWKSKAQGLVLIAQLQQLDVRAKNRYQAVLETLEAAEKETVKVKNEIDSAIVEHNVKGEILKREAAALREERRERGVGNVNSNDKGKGKARDESPLRDDEVDENEEDEDTEEDKGLPKTPAGREHRDKGRALRQRLRETQIVLHRVIFLKGDVYHNLGPDYAAQEDKAYQDADELRRGLLKFTAEKAKQGMAQLQVDATKSGVDEKGLMIPVPYLDQGGIRSAESIEELHEIIEDVLNPQNTLLWEWRAKIHALLTTSLAPGEGEADGEEYQRTLDDQGEAEIYLQAYQALLADRREALFKERTLLAAHETKEKKFRKTKAALKAVAAAADEALDIPEDIVLQPEHQVLHQQLAERRKDLLNDLGGKAAKSILVELTGAFARVIKDTDPEKKLLEVAVKDLQTYLDKLDADLALFRKAFNHRVLYFRQLQEISDTVAEAEFEGTREEALVRAQTLQNEYEAKLNTSRARQRYLDHLAKTQRGDLDDDEENCCILCRCEFERGYMTHCAHIFCEGCMVAWLKKPGGKACPVCRVPIDMENLQRFLVNSPEQPPPKVMKNGELAPMSKRKIEYNMIDPTLFGDIQTMESFGDFGAKIQTLVRHLLYLQTSDPGAKSIVFSAWADSLLIVERALRENGIGCLRIDQGAKKNAASRFKADPDILVLLLHGERENAGLNITCASRVFLLESVVHHGFELQAIARVDRMGQTRSTEVYCYYAEDTIERNILDLAARQGLSLYTKDNSTGTLNVSTFVADQEKTVTVEAPAKKKSGKAQKGDFISKVDDMLAILFPHMYEDVEYLIDDQDVVMGDITNTQNTAHAGDSRQLGKKPSGHVNAVAGPSRLH